MFLLLLVIVPLAWIQYKQYFFSACIINISLL
ncbi:hypothetical protein AAUPMG_05269, partial [Pasteurella multocida subsp. multocida str. Anand1_goat]